MKTARLVATIVCLALGASACSGPILANPRAVVAAPPTSSPGPSRAPDPQPIVFPRDEAPHDRLTEWWYYTGHLADDAGGHRGFEFVIFRAERGGFPVTWASHVALTDETAGTFQYAQRTEVGPQVAGLLISPFSFDLGIAGQAEGPPWSMVGSPLLDELRFSLSPAESATTTTPIDVALQLISSKPPALHGSSGWIDFGPAGGSYYYSRTHLGVGGHLTVGARRLDVTGEAWFDHQWGDFISVGGGWDWFAVNLDDGTDLTVSRVRAADGTYPLVYGTLVDASGGAHHLASADFTVTSDPDRTWTSPTTGAVYPADWMLVIPGEDLRIALRPTVANQELDTRPSTGVAYWEGSQVVTATRAGTPVGGEAYVELTGYAPAKP